MNKFKSITLFLVAVTLAISMSADAQIQASDIRNLKTFSASSSGDSTKLVVLTQDNQSVRKANPVDLLPYKVYEGLLTQATDSTITVTTLRNTIGTITWATTTAGLFTATKTGAWTSAKTAFYFQPTIKTDTAVIVSGVRTSANVLTFVAERAGTRVDTSAVAMPFEIRVYK
jgi:hypothetical protein